MTIIDNIKKKSGAFIIAEVGVNYYDIAKKMDISVIDAALLMIEEAAKGGADAVKFQTYKAEKIVSKHSPAYWDLKEEPTTTQFELFKKFDQFGEAEYAKLAKHCESVGHGLGANKSGRTPVTNIATRAVAAPSTIPIRRWTGSIIVANGPNGRSEMLDMVVCNTTANAPSWRLTMPAVSAASQTRECRASPARGR